MLRLLRNSRMICSLLSPSLFFFMTGVSFAGGGILHLQKTASFDQKLNVPDAIKSDCQLETKVIEFVESFAGEDFEKIILVDTVSGSTPGKAMTIVITDLSGAGGGAWSGPKHLTIDGTLWQDGKVLGTFSATRVTGGGAWGAYKGTCSLLGRCAKTLGKDVAVWLKSPSMGAKLGDAK